MYCREKLYISRVVWWWLHGGVRGGKFHLGNDTQLDGQQLLWYDWQESLHHSLDGTISLSGARPSEEDARGGGQMQDNKSNLFFLVF